MSSDEPGRVLQHTVSSSGDVAALDRALVSGLAWTAIAKSMTQILSWLSTLLVVRLLTPEDYGVVGMALVYLGLVHLLNDLGLGAAIVQNRSLTDSQISRLYGVALSFGLSLTLVSFGLSWPIASFFRNEEVRLVVIALSVTLFLSGVQLVPRSLLARNLQFDRIARVDAAHALTSTAATLVLALLGFRYWALVFGNILGVLAATTTLLLYHRHPAAWPRQIHELFGSLRFGSYVLVSTIAWYFYVNADSVIAGRLLGTAKLGVYTVAVSLAVAPVNQVIGVVQRVTGGIFSASQSDLPLLRRYATGLIETIAFLVFPATMGLALVAPDFVLVVLGNQWVASIVPLRLLAIEAAFRCLSPILSQALLYSGHPERNTRITLMGAVIMPALFLIGAQWGLAGIAAGWIFGTVVVILPVTLYFTRRDIGLSIRAFFSAITAPAVCTVIMSGAVVAVAVVVRSTDASPLLLIAKIVTGVGVYALSFRLLFWSRFDNLRAMIQRVRG